MTSDGSGILWRHSQQSNSGFFALSEDLGADLLVIGGGFTGCSAALEAAKFGASVVLLEAETCGHGGSGRNVGLVNAGLWMPPDQIVNALGEKAGARLIDALAVAPDLVFSLINEHGIECQATRHGTLHLAHARAGLADLESRLRQGLRIGAPLQLLDAEETARRTGSTAFFGGLFDPRAGTVQPLDYCRGLTQAAKDAGARIYERSGVSDITFDGSRWIAHSNGREVRAKHLILATNAYGGGLSGAPKPEFVPVYYSQFATAPIAAAKRRHILPGGEGCWDTDRVMSSVRIDHEGRLIIGGVGNLGGATAKIHMAWAARKLAQLYPELAGTPFRYSWSGAIAMTADHLPKVLRFGENALSIFGYSGRGIGPGTVFGKGAARALLLGDKAALPMDIAATYREHFKAPRNAFFEAGAALTHALSPNPFCHPSSSKHTTHEIDHD